MRVNCDDRQTLSQICVSSLWDVPSAVQQTQGQLSPFGQQTHGFPGLAAVQGCTCPGLALPRHGWRVSLQVSGHFSHAGTLHVRNRAHCHHSHHHDVMLGQSSLCCRTSACWYSAPVHLAPLQLPSRPLLPQTNTMVRPSRTWRTAWRHCGREMLG